MSIQGCFNDASNSINFNDVNGRNIIHSSNSSLSSKFKRRSYVEAHKHDIYYQHWIGKRQFLQPTNGVMPESLPSDNFSHELTFRV